MKTTFAIIGGGIAGLTTAIALQKAGIEAEVFEAAPAFKPVGAGLVLAANAMKAYQQLGLYDELEAVGHQVKYFSIFDEAGKTISRTQTQAARYALVNLAIHRAELHRVLLSQLNTSRVHTAKRSKEIRRTGEGYELVFEDGSRLEAKYLIVAEGIHSPLRQQLMPEAQLRYSGYTCWRGIAENDELNLSDAFETWGSRGRFGAVAVGKGKVYWYAVKNAAPDDAAMKALGTHELQQIFTAYHQPIVDIINTTPDQQMIWNDIYDLKPIKHFAFDQLLLIGDSAHATTPNMGQGACQAIEDAVVLAQCLQQHSEVNEAFRAFEKRRLARTHYIVKQSWRMGRIAQWENSLANRLRNSLFRSLPESVYRKQLEKVYEVDFA